jgi:hypothetical protein
LQTPAQPVAQVAPSNLTFGSQTVGVVSEAQSVTLNNTGDAALSLTSVAVTGTNASDFVPTNTCATSLATGSHCTFSVTFTPSATGSRAASLTITDNATGSPQMVSLTGTGAAPVVSLSPSSLSFANQSLGTASMPQTVTLTNSGNAALNVTSLAITGANAGDFSQASNCGNSVAAGANCTINVTFTPSASGSRAAALTVTDDATGSPQMVSLTGTGTAPVVSLSPSSLSFVNQLLGTVAVPQTITLTNTGNAALSVTSLAIIGANPTDFAQTNNCGSSVTAGANCTINVTFTPSASGSRAAALAVTDNATGSPQTVSLSGTSAPPVVALSPTSLSFANEPVNVTSSSQAVHLSNSGGASLNVTSIAFTGTFATDFTEIDTCSASVAVGGNCTIAIMFTPSAIGASVASLNIIDNASGSPQSAALSGTGTHDVILSWTPSTTPGVAGYNVFRGTAAAGESATPLNSTPIDGTTYTDENVTAGTTYYYVVTAVAADDVTQSADSNEASATVPSP